MFITDIQGSKTKFGIYVLHSSESDVDNDAVGMQHILYSFE